MPIKTILQISQYFNITIWNALCTLIPLILLQFLCDIVVEIFITLDKI